MMFYFRTMSKRLLRTNAIFIVLVLFLFGGCAAPTKVIQVVQPPHLPTTSKFIEPETPLKRFIPENGVASITKDDVTVKVADITDKMADSEFSTEIDGPNGNKHWISISPMMLVLEIKNGTDHIITLARTIISIEDKNQHAYPLINSMPESRAELITYVSKKFDQYLVDASAEYKKNVYGEYMEKHKSFEHKLRAATKMSAGDSITQGLVSGLVGGKTSNIADVRTSDMEAGKVLTELGITQKIKNTSPDIVYAKGSSQLQNKILMLKSKAVQKIRNEIKVSGKNTITGGVYLPINILPKRTAKIVAPFSNTNSDKEITSLVIGVYDLPTEVNQAGDPVKRANFTFTMNASK